MLPTRKRIQNNPRTGQSFSHATPATGVAPLAVIGAAVVAGDHHAGKRHIIKCNHVADYSADAKLDFEVALPAAAPGCAGPSNPVALPLNLLPTVSLRH